MTIHRTFASGQSAGFRIPADVNYAEARVNGVPTPAPTVAGFVLLGFVPAAGAVVDIEYDEATAPDVTFFAPLVCNTFLPVGQGSATFTRATTATVEDQDGVLRTALAGEVRFTGARRVRNWSQSSDPVHASWLVLGGGTKTTGQSDPFGGTLAAKFNGPANHYCQINSGTVATLQSGSLIQGSVWLRAASNFSCYFRVTDATDGTPTYFTNVNVTTSWQRFSILYTATAASGQAVGLLINSEGAQAIDFYVSAPQFEDVTGQSNTNPSEYVSVGVLASPYHGSHVDGVKCFRHLNGNTVAANVVTEARGADIAAGTLKKYLPEGARTNLCLQSEDFSSASWAKSDTTITANNIVAPDGNTTADLFTEGVGGAAAVQQPVTATASVTHSLTRFIKRGNTDWVRLDIYGGVNGIRGWFNLATGVVGSTALFGTGSAASIGITALPNGWYRCFLAGVVGVDTAVNNNSSSSNADASLVRVNNSTRYEWGAQFENNDSFASAYIPTTAVAVTRNADVMTYPGAGNTNAAEGTLYAEWVNQALGSGAGYTPGEHDPFCISPSGPQWFLDKGNNQIYVKNRIDGAQISPGLIVPGTVNKLASSWKTGGTYRCSLNGAAVVAGTQTATGTLTTIDIGSNGGANPLWGNIGMIRISPYQVSDSLHQELTR